MPQTERLSVMSPPEHIARISRPLALALGGLVVAIFIVFSTIWIGNARAGAGFDLTAFGLAIAVGMFAQMVDGALGMAYGVTSNTLLLAIGLPPATATATVHVAEAFTTAASGLSHWRLGNIDKRIFRRIVIPGIVGGVLGVLLITSIDGKLIRPWVSGYLLLIGLFIIYKAYRQIQVTAKFGNKLIPLALVGGFADSVGGGGWGPVVTTTLIGSGHEPRTTIGSVNAAEFFVTLASGFSFALLIGIQNWESIIGLVLGGLIVAPFAAGLTQRINPRLLMVLVGLLISGLSIFTILRALNG